MSGSIPGSVAVGAGMLGFWLLFAGSLGWEWVFGAVAAALAAVAIELTRQQGLAPMRIRAGWLVALVRVPWDIVQGSVQLTWILLRRPLATRPMLLRSAPFSVQAGALGAGRRALAIASNTISPPTIVVHIDTARERLFLHQMTADGVPALIRALEGEENEESQA